MPFFALGLSNPKTPCNVGSVLRIAGNFNAAFLAVTGQRAFRHPTDTMKAYRHLPLLRPESLREVIPADCVPVALDLIEGATPLPAYTHPKNAFYIFGPEDGTLGRGVTDWCRDVVYVPTNQRMNLAVCVAVVLYDRMAKENTI